MKKWLQQMEAGFPELQEEVEMLESARSFRGRFIDHPQAVGGSLDWMTVSVEDLHGKYLVVLLMFRRPLGSPLMTIPSEHLNPYEPGFHPGVIYESCHVPPCVVCVYSQLWDFARTTAKRYGLDWEKPSIEDHGLMEFLYGPAA